MVACFVCISFPSHFGGWIDLWQKDSPVRVQRFWPSYQMVGGPCSPRFAIKKSNRPNAKKPTNQGLNSFICTHHGHFHADEAQTKRFPRKITEFFGRKLSGMTHSACFAHHFVVFFFGKIFHQDLDLFFLETQNPIRSFYLVSRRRRAGYGLCHAEMSGCWVAVAPLASISW